MFQDEARFGRISDTRRCWCPKPVRPLCQKAMVTQEYTYAYAAVSVTDGVLDALILPHVNGACMQLFLDEVCARHPDERIVMVLDGAGWHQSASLRLAHNLRLLTLPPYSPELNPVEHLWDDLPRKVLSQPRIRGVSMRSNTICATRFATLNWIINGFAPSSRGHGSLIHC